MRTISELDEEIDYLKNTVACLKGENAALKAELAQQPHNSKSMPCSRCKELEASLLRIGNVVNVERGLLD